MDIYHFSGHERSFGVARYLVISFSLFPQGQVHIDEMYLMFFNVLFTGVPPLISGILDQDLSRSTLFSHSYIYKLGQADVFYRVIIVVLVKNCDFHLRFQHLT